MLMEMEFTFCQCCPGRQGVAMKASARLLLRERAGVAFFLAQENHAHQGIPCR